MLCSWRQQPNAHGSKCTCCQSNKEPSPVISRTRSPVTDGASPTEPWSQHHRARLRLHEDAEDTVASKLWLSLEAWNKLLLAKYLETQCAWRIGAITKSEGSHTKCWFDQRPILSGTRPTAQNCLYLKQESVCAEIPKQILNHLVALSLLHEQAKMIYPVSMLAVSETTQLAIFLNLHKLILLIT